MKTREIAEFLGGELHGDGNVEITSIAGINEAGPGQLAFFESSTKPPETNASCLLATQVWDSGAVYIVVPNPKLAFARAAKKLIPYKSKYEGSRDEGYPFTFIAETADVRTVDIGKFVTIGEHSYVGEGCEVGDGTQIGNNVTIKKFTVIHQNCVINDNVEIGYDCVIHSGTVIGADGFGYVTDESGEHVKFPQIGTVVIEDNVEIGANSCVDRGSLGETRIGAGTKIDNLVQIAHNVQIGKNCIIVALSGISGSSVLEDNVVLAGQVGIADHVLLKRGVVIAAKSAVFPNKVISEGIWGGIPAQPLKKYKESTVALRGLGRMREEINALKRTMKSNESE